jgi:two-component system LytT family response regulator
MVENPVPADAKGSKATKPSRWRVLIADDEPAARRGVRQLLAAYPDFAVVGECRDGREVLNAIDSLRPDVVFLDIQMPEVNGFDVIRRRTPARMPAVVFLTAYDRFALRAFEVEAHDYLVKPVTDARFAATMQRLTRRLDSGSPASDPAIVVSTGRGLTVLPLREIDWIEAADNYARLWIGERSYLLREALTHLEPRITPHGFTRAHRQALVRLGSVREVRTTSAGELVAELASGTLVPVSRRRRAAFLAAMRRPR